MIALGGALNQTSVVAKQFVIDGIQKLEELKYAPVKAVLPTWTGALLAIGLGSKSFANAFTSLFIGTTTAFDGTYLGTISGAGVCVTPDGTTITTPVSNPFGFTVTNGAVVGTNGKVDSIGNLNPPIVISTVTYKGTLNTGTPQVFIIGIAKGTWSVSGLPDGCKEGGDWSANLQ
jgi:hypothetical protein